jgi:outer membrane protein TolC
MNTLAKLVLTSAIAAIMVGGSGCAVTPEKMSHEDRVNRAASDMEAMFKDQEAITGSISLSEAMARAVKYNLDYRVKLLEEAMSEAEHNVARMDMLPQMAVNAGYVDRSNVNASSSQSVITGAQSLESSTSEERQRTISDASLVWNVLDFGISYVTAQQRSDQILIANEKRRKSIQNIIQDVRVAYWQAVSADDLATETEDLIREARKSLKESRDLEEKGIQAPLEAMQFQEGLLATMRVLWQLRERLATSKAELASLMNVRPGSDFTLQPGDGESVPAPIATKLEELENFALLHRPELREADYQVRISSKEVKKAMLRMLPGLEVNLGGFYDSNKYLYNSDWSDAGIRITWNLFNLFSGPANKRRAEAQVNVDEMKRMAMSMAVLTQTNVAYQRYQLARNDFDLAESILTVKQDIASQQAIRAAASVSDELSSIRSKAEVLVARMQRDLSLAGLQNAVGRTLNSIGMDPLPKEVSGYEINVLAGAIAQHQTTLATLMVQPTMDASSYDAIAKKLKADQDAREAEAARVAAAKAAEERRLAAIAAREKAIADKNAADENARLASLTEAERRAAAEKSAAEARNVQQAAIDAALDEAEKLRQAKIEAAKQEAMYLEIKAEEERLAEEARLAADLEVAQADAARAAAEKAAEEARVASEQAVKRKAETEQKVAEAKAAREAAEAARLAEAERIANEVRASINAAIAAGLVAGGEEQTAKDAAKAAEVAANKAAGIVVPPPVGDSVPEASEPAGSGAAPTTGPMPSPLLNIDSASATDVMLSSPFSQTDDEALASTEQELMQGLYPAISEPMLYSAGGNSVVTEGRMQQEMAIDTDD